jgi:hypothetical protein
VKEKLLAVVVLLGLWLAGLVALLVVLIGWVIRLRLWAILLVLVLAIGAGNLPLALVMVLVLGSVVAGQVRG